MRQRRCFINDGSELRISGDPSPSAADIQLTRAMREAANMMQITFLDHVIIGDASDDPLQRGYYSFREAGLI